MATRVVNLVAGYPSQAYGAFADNQTQTNAGATSANVMLFRTTEFAKGVSIVSDSRITLESGGVYNIQFSSQFSRAGGTGFSTIEIWLSKNGANVPETNTQLNVPQSGGKAVAAWNFVVEANSGDYYQLYWASSDTSVEMWYAAAGTGPTRPETPSVIMTVTQVG
jgi:hypothetical protein